MVSFAPITLPEQSAKVVQFVIQTAEKLKKDALCRHKSCLENGKPSRLKCAKDHDSK